MDIWHSLGGIVDVELISADIPAALTAISRAGIPLYNSETKDEFTIHFSIDRKNFKKLKHILKRRGEKFKVYRKHGLYWRFKSLLRRPVLVFGLAALLAFACFVPSRIFFIRVEGNISLPTNLILEQAAQSGICFGSSRREVRSEKMKNRLLEALPQLQWAGINTNGCVATITVRERQETEKPQVKTGVSSIVATCDGVVLSCTATKGNLLCKPGQAVKTGQTLISGYTDCGLSLRATQAAGEIYARTQRELSVVCLSSCRKKEVQTKIVKKYSLIVGKKRINLSKDSGILDTSCDKMYVEDFITLPGGFQLPVSIVTETWIIYECVEMTQEEALLTEQVSSFARSQLKQSMIAGEILTASEKTQMEDACYRLEGQYACREMIGRVQEEEIITPYGKND